MKKWLLSLPLTRAYTIAGLIYSVPLVIAAGVLVYLAHGSLADADEAVRTVGAGGEVPHLEFVDRSKQFAVLLLGTVLAGGLLTKIWLSGDGMKSTEKLVEGTRRAAAGDLTASFESSHGNEYGRLQREVEALLSGFRATVTRIEAAATDMNFAAAELTHTSDETGRAISEVAVAIGAISEGAAHQSALVGDVSQVMGEIELSIKDASEHAVEAQRQSGDTERLADDGVEAAERVLSSMQAVREQSLASEAVIRELGEKSQSIDQIVGAIAEIAGQTNMLALNAAIEAARAGEAGKGFGNVANEVRALADDAQHSADQINKLVAQIQNQTGAAVAAMEQAGRAVEAGFETINSNRQSFLDVGSAVNHLSGSAAEISELAAGIAFGAGQVRAQILEVAAVAQEQSASTEEVSAATQQTAAGAQDVSEAAGRVAQTASGLSELADRFVLPQEIDPQRSNPEQ